MFSHIGDFAPCGIFTFGHFSLLAVTVLGIYFGLKHTRSCNARQVQKILQISTAAIWLLEVIKIIYNISETSWTAVNEYLPLYYCSMLLYAGIFSTLGKGRLKRTGDVFLAAGAFVGGAVFMLYPSTSLPNYPAFHFISVHSFVYHGLMVYLGILVNVTGYVTLEKKDISCFAALVGTMCLLASVANGIFDSNLMFISQDFPGTPVGVLYDLTGGTALFGLFMTAGQVFLPFYASLLVLKRKRKPAGDPEQLQPCV